MTTKFEEWTYIRQNIFTVIADICKWCFGYEISNDVCGVLSQMDLTADSTFVEFLLLKCFQPYQLSSFQASFFVWFLSIIFWFCKKEQPDEAERVLFYYDSRLL